MLGSGLTTTFNGIIAIGGTSVFTKMKNLVTLYIFLLVISSIPAYAQSAKKAVAKQAIDAGAIKKWIIQKLAKNPGYSSSERTFPGFTQVFTSAKRTKVDEFETNDDQLVITCNEVSGNNSDTTKGYFKGTFRVRWSAISQVVARANVDTGIVNEHGKSHEISSSLIVLVGPVAYHLTTTSNMANPSPANQQEVFFYFDTFRND